MEKAIVPGVVFLAKMNEVDVVGYEFKEFGAVEYVLNEVSICAKVLDWHFHIHNFSNSRIRKKIMYINHVDYSIQVIESSNKRIFQPGEVYKLRGRRLYSDIKYFLIVPENANEIVKNLSYENYRALVFEKAASDFEQCLRKGCDIESAYEYIDEDISNFLW